MFVVKSSESVFDENILISCPYCQTLHNELKWISDKKKAFRKCFKFCCDNCGVIIPFKWKYFICLFKRNIFSISAGQSSDRQTV